MATEGEKLVKETLAAASNYDDVMTVLNAQSQIKTDLNNDAMDEIKPYIEQGV